MADTYLLIDWSNFAHTAYWPAVSAKEADAKYDLETVFKTNLEQKLDTIHRVLAENGITSFRTFFVEDRMAKAKLELFPLYKANREKVEWEINPKEVGKAYLIKRYPNAIWAHSPDNEADDAIASIIQACPGYKFVIASSDKDLWQLASANTKVFRLTSNRFMTLEDVEKEFRTTRTDLIPLYKALWGDSGDGVPNVVPRMQKQLMPVLEASTGTLESFLAVYQSAKLNLTQRCQALVDENLNGISTNWALVKLNGSLPVSLEVPRATIPADSASECGEGQQR